MKYLVTGGSGFIGQHLCRKLFADGHDVRVIDRVNVPNPMDLADSSPLLMNVLASRMESVDGVFHLAGNAGWRECEDRPDLAFENVRGTYSVLKIATMLRKPVVFTSSATVYGTPNRSPMMVGVREHPESLYAISKKAGEDIAWHLIEEGLQVGIARIFNIYGPDQHHAVTYTSAFVPNIIRKLQMRPSLLPCFGEWWITRDFVYVTDACSALQVLMARVRTGQNAIVNVGSGGATKHNDVVRLIADIMGSVTTFEYDHKLGNDVGRLKDVPYCADATPLHMMGWKPEVSLAEGLARTVASMG